MNATSIEWCNYSASLLKYRDESGKVVWHCEKLSPGCAHCYAEAIAERFDRGGPFLPMVTPTVTPFFDEEEAKKILRSKKLAGKRVFVNDMTDWMGSWVPDEIIDKHFAVFALRPDVVFQTLTKRPERMVAYMNRAYSRGYVADAAVKSFGRYIWNNTVGHERQGNEIAGPEWPLPNVWLGTSVEDQKRADERIPLLLKTPAAVRFLSCEPLLGPVNLPTINSHAYGSWPQIRAQRAGSKIAVPVDWVIVGGESGKGARPCDAAWVLSIVNQCKSTDVSCFVKQLGSMVFNSTEEAFCEFDCEHTWVCKARSWLGGISGGGQKYKKPEKAICVDTKGRWCQMGAHFMRATAEGTYPIKAYLQVPLSSAKGGDPLEWPEPLRVREFPATKE